jgi:pseudouridine-5'-phosphate glycosidase
LGVPVIGFQINEFPAFYSRHSGLQVDVTVQSADEAATLAACHWRTGAKTAVLVCVPVPEEFEIPASEVENAVREAMRLADAQGIRGKAVTPFLLEKMKELTGGNTLKANRALLVNNADVAGQIAASLSRLG